MLKKKILKKKLLKKKILTKIKSKVLDLLRFVKKLSQTRFYPKLKSLSKDAIKLKRIAP